MDKLLSSARNGTDGEAVVTLAPQVVKLLFFHCAIKKSAEKKLEVYIYFTDQK
jgi:hypothetical protein